jgi:N-acetyl sugar amidotransferase
MDNIADPTIQFDDEGVSNYWHDYQNVHLKKIKQGEEGKKQLQIKVEEIKKAGKGAKYDCIIGLSGGVDSTYIAYLVKQYGLRPLAIHFDNGWNSNIAVQNIHKIVNYLQCDLYTLVVDWEEFKDLQLAYLKASVIDIEVLTDHAIVGTLFRQAAKHNIKHVLSGNNIATESILPSPWVFNKLDAENIKAIHKQFGALPMKTYPLFTFLDKKYYFNFKKLLFVEPLNYGTYVKEEVKRIISEEIGWEDYGGKHFESVFTRFYQAYILPVKFKVDKRKAHLSNLICSGQLSREEALQELEKPIYDTELEKKDKTFVIKKFGLTEAEFDRMMQMPEVPHEKYATEGPIDQHYPILKPVKKIYHYFNRKKA